MGLNPGHIPDLEIKDTFPSTTGIVAWTTNLYKDGVASGVSVTVAEIGSTGNYSVAFTPDSNGLWAIQVYETADDTNEFVESYHVYSPAEDVLLSSSADATLTDELDALEDSTQSGTDEWLYHGHTIRITSGAANGHEAVVQCWNDNDNTWLFTPRAPAAIASGVTYEITNETHPVQQDIVIRSTLSGTESDSRSMQDSVQLTSPASNLEGMSFALLKKGVANVHRKIVHVDPSSNIYRIDTEYSSVTAVSGDPYYVVKEYQEFSPFISFEDQAVDTDGGSFTTTYFEATTGPSLDDSLIGHTIKFTSGNNEGEVRLVTDYDGTNKGYTLDTALSNTPVVGERFQVLSLFDAVNPNIWDSLVSSHTTSGTFGELFGKKVLTVARFLGLK